MFTPNCTITYAIHKHVPARAWRIRVFLRMNPTRTVPAGERTERVEAPYGDDMVYCSDVPLPLLMRDITPTGMSVFEDEEGLFLIPTVDIIAISYDSA